MRNNFRYIIVLMFVVGALSSCGHRKTRLAVETDSLSYVVGLNVGQVLLAMDSTLNVDAVCSAIRDVYRDEQKMTMEEARNYYLAEKTFFVHERAKAHEEQYLTDLSKNDRKYVRTRSGVTYKIERLGDQSNTRSMNLRDTVRIAYTMSDEQGRVIVERDTLRDSYRNLVKGLQEVVRLAGDGAHFNAWLPSELAYGVEGNDSLKIAANTMLNYDVEILDIEYYKY